MFSVSPGCYSGLFLRGDCFRGMDNPTIIVAGRGGDGGRVAFHGMCYGGMPALTGCAHDGATARITRGVCGMGSCSRNLRVSGVISVPRCRALISVRPVRGVPITRLVSVPTLPTVTA